MNTILETLPPLKSLQLLNEKNGIVYTKPWVINLILDMVGYTPDQALYEHQIVEPAAGNGAFLRQIIDRLAVSCGRNNRSLAECKLAIKAYELNDESAARCKASLHGYLQQHGLSLKQAQNLANAWLITGDYLLEAKTQQTQADYVVGNPPYIRMEDMYQGGARYRALYKTMVGRADIYVAFYEAALRQLKPGGICGLICADRWMFNQYGAELRNFITKDFSVDAVIQMHHADAFDREVSAYPAVTIIRKGCQGPVMVANLDPAAEHIGASALMAEMKPDREDLRRTTNAARIDQWFIGDAPWPLIEPKKLALLRRLEANFSIIEETGATVGIGVATGADKVFVTKDPTLVEKGQLLPLAMAADVKGSRVCWSGHYLVNPWNEIGLVDLDQYPQLARYFEHHEAQLRERHIAKKRPANWYRTIDKVNTNLAGRSKLYLPDFKGRIAPVLDRGETYPHHNLYFIAPGPWDAEVLGGLLLSDVAQFFIEAYGLKMRGGYFRFQAQYLRRIRLPDPSMISESQAEDLRLAFEAHDVDQANAVAAKLYKLTPKERILIEH